MACSMSEEVSETVNREVEEWLIENNDGSLILLDVNNSFFTSLIVIVI